MARYPITMDDIPDSWHPMSRMAAWRALEGRDLGARAGNMLTGADIPIRMALARQQGPLNPHQFTPTGRAGMNVPRRFQPRTPGLRAEALAHGDDWVDFMGDLNQFKKPSEPGGMQIESDMGWLSPARRGYNLRNEKNEIVASADRLRGKNIAVIPSMWVRPDYRKTGAMFDMMNLLTHGGKLKPGGEFMNERLEKVFNRRFDPERNKVLKAVAKVKAPPPKKPTQLDRDISELRRAAEEGRGRQVTNRDIGHPLTPVRRPPPPRPVREKWVPPVEQQRLLGQELRNRRRGGV